jgi:hypothetical protein
MRKFLFGTYASVTKKELLIIFAPIFFLLTEMAQRISGMRLSTPTQPGCRERSCRRRLLA